MDALLERREPRIRIAIGPEGGWVALRGNEHYSHGIPSGLQDRLRQLEEQGKVFDAVAIGPDRSWTIVAQDAQWTRGVPDRPGGYFDSLQGLLVEGRRIRAVAFNPDRWAEHHGFVIAYDGGFVGRYIPDELRARLEEVSRAARIDAVAFTPGGGWVVAGGESVWARGVSEHVLDILIETIEIDGRIDAVTFDPRDTGADRGWLVVGPGGFAADHVPARLTARLETSWPGSGDVFAVEDANEGATASKEPSATVPETPEDPPAPSRLRLAIAPDGGWVVLQGNRVRHEGLPPEMHDRLASIAADYRRFDAVAFGPGGEWTVVAEDAHWTRGLPEDEGGYYVTLGRVIRRGLRVRAVAFNPVDWQQRHGFVIVHSEGFEARNVPAELRAKLEEYSEQGVIDDVDFAPHGGWSIVAGTRHWTRDLSGPYFQSLGSLMDTDGVMALAFDPRDADPRRGWVLVGKGGHEQGRYLASDVPEGLTATLQDDWLLEGRLLVEESKDGPGSMADASTEVGSGGASRSEEIEVGGVVRYDHALDSGSFAEFFPGKVRNVIVEHALDRDGDGAVSGFDIRFQADVARYVFDDDFGRRLANGFLQIASLLPGVPDLPKFERPPAMAPQFCVQVTTAGPGEIALTTLTPLPPRRPRSMDFVVRFGIVQEGAADRSYPMDMLIDHVEGDEIRALSEIEVKTSHRAIEGTRSARRRAQEFMDGAFGPGRVTVTGDPKLDENLRDPCGMGSSSATLSIGEASPLRLETPSEDGVLSSNEPRDGS